MNSSEELTNKSCLTIEDENGIRLEVTGNGEIVRIDKDDPNKLVKITSVGMFHSEDGGKTWSSVWRYKTCEHCNGTGKVLV